MKIKHNNISVSICVRSPDFIDNLERVMKKPEIIEGIKQMNLGYGVNRSTTIQYLVEKEINKEIKK